MALIDVNKQFQEIEQAAVSAIQSIFPVEKEKHKLVLNRVWVEDTQDPYNYKKQAQIKNKGGTWGADVYADLSLIDKATKKTIDRQKKVKIMLLPKMTDRLSYIVRGNEYQVTNQLRLKSGAYVKQMKDGGVKTFFNMAKGKTAELHIDDKGIIKMSVGQAKIPLYPILSGLGISDSEIQKDWGEKVLDQNRESRTTPQQAVKRLAASLAGSKTSNFETAKDEIKAYIKDKTEILPKMTKFTLGKEFNKFTPQLWLAASKKLIDVHKGVDEPDDVDNLAFKEFFGEEDSIKERIEKNKGMLLNKINRNLDSRDKISQILNLSTFGNLIETFFTEDERSSTPEQINPLHMYAGREKVSFLGPGAISSTRMATEGTRSVHPTHLSFLDPVHTPESDKIGLSLGLAMRTRKVGNEIKTAFYDVKNKKMVELSPTDIYDKIVAFPDHWDMEKKKFTSSNIKAQKKGKIVNVSPREVDYVIPSPQFAFSLSSNMIPFMASDNGNRTMMAGKHMEQAISLKDREVPLVQNKAPGQKNVSFEKAFGEAFVAQQKSPVDGTITKVGKDSITVKSGRNSYEVPLYNNYSLNQKTFMHHEPLVKVGDKVDKGQILAESNYTKDGVLALGRNLKVAYLPYKGYNFEDGIVITESAAKKLTSEHITKVTMNITPKTVLDLAKFAAFFPNTLTQENRSKLDEFGIVKKGSRILPGDILIAAIRDTGGFTGLESIKASFNKSAGTRFRPMVEEWNYEFPAEISNVIKNNDNVTVFVKSSQPAVIGDKLAGRHGNKGIITKIIPDDQAPSDKDGNPVEVLLNPHGVVSRINIGQMYESAMGKAAEKKGKPYIVQNFTGENYLNTVNKALKEANVNDREELYDPQTGKSLGQVHVGKPYILKLNKQSDVNFSVRGESGPVTKTTEQPIKGGPEGAKALDMLTLYTLLSHGAKANLKEMSTYKSENNPELWEAIKYGKHLPAPKVPFVFNKFVNMLKGSGVNVKKDGSKFYLGPLTDEHTKKLSSMEIEEPLFIRSKGIQRIPTKGGFIDPVKLGGPDGTNWAHISMKESTVNPIFEEPVKSLLGLSKTEYDSIVSGQKSIDVDGKSLTGGAAIRALLKKVDISKELSELEPKLKKLKGSELNKYTRKFRYLKALETAELSPDKAYTRDKIPVIPPKFRPISQLDSGDLAYDDLNVLYRNVALINQQMGLPVTNLLSDEDLKDVRQELNQNIKALSGLETIKIGGRDKSGFISQIKGSQPKEGFYQNKVLRKNQNLVGRGTIIPEPQLHMDEIQIPEKMAWKLYSPFATKELISKGMTAREAKDQLEGRTNLARNALDNAMSKRPLMLNRAPSLHKFSIMAFQPKITHGKAIKIPPLVVSGFNADFDGDTMTAHVPISDEAIREAYNMMPSRNLYKPGTGQLMVGPSQESQLGFYLLTKDPAGRAKLNSILPVKYKITKEMDKKASRELFMKLSKEMPSTDFAKLIDEIKRMGETAAYDKGFSLSLKDIDVLPNKSKILSVLDKTVDSFLDGKITEQQFQDRIAGPKGLNKILDAQIKEHLKGKDNALYEMVNSGARGSESQLRQIVGSPMIVQDPYGGLIPKAIRNSYAEGLNLSDYWVSSYGARKGMMDRALSTQEPGEFNKSLTAVTLSTVITMEDCGTQEGEYFPPNSEEILGRFIQGNQAGIPDETIIDENAVKKLKNAKLKRVYVRTPLKCKAPEGVCVHCYGVDENGRVVKVGDNVGAKTAQALSEPMQQMVMNTFHTGGVAGTGKGSGAARVNQLLNMPKDIKVGKSTLATLNGTVSRIEPSGLGGYNVYIDDVKHVTGPKLKLKVKVGDLVTKGDQLSEGVIAPQELLHYKGLPKVQDYLTNELQKAYHSQGMNVDRKTFETVVRALTNRTTVKNNPLHSSFLPGDSIPYTVADEYNKNRKFTTGINDAKGFFLSKNTGNLEKGTHLTSKEINMLKGLGIKELDVEKDKIEHEPYLKGFKYLPNEGSDWLAQLGARRIKDAIVKGSTQGWMSDVKSYHPIPAYAYGATFGDDPGGKY